jgi:hypothetical protein
MMPSTDSAASRRLLRHLQRGTRREQRTLQLQDNPRAVLLFAAEALRSMLGALDEFDLLTRNESEGLRVIAQAIEVRVLAGKVQP